MLVWQNQSEKCDWNMSPAISVNKGCCNHQTISHYSPEGAQDGDKQAVHLQANSHCRCPQPCALKGFRMEKSRILTPERQGADQRSDFNEPRLLHLPILRKMLNLLTWAVWFSFIKSNLLMFWLLGFVAKTHMCPGLSLTSSEQSLRDIWEALFEAQVLSKSAK